MAQDGKVALVTGAGRGIGRGVALRLAGDGFDLALAEVRADLAESVKDEIEGLGRRCFAFPCDVSKKAQVLDTVTRTMEEFGRIDVLVNNAGVIRTTPILEVSEEEWDFVLAINLKGVLFFCQAVAPHMIQAKRGKIVNIASGAARRGWPTSVHYAASKAGVVSVTWSFALALAPCRINVNAVCPGIVDTEMWVQIDQERAAMEGLPQGEVFRRAVERVPLGRAETPQDVAAVVSFLASPDSDYMTGQSIYVNGGTAMV